MHPKNPSKASASPDAAASMDRPGEAPRTTGWKADWRLPLAAWALWNVFLLVMVFA